MTYVTVKLERFMTLIDKCKNPCLEQCAIHFNKILCWGEEKIIVMKRMVFSISSV